MIVSIPVQDIFLQPGDLHIGDKSTRIRTVLGSCVSVVVWHPGILVGGMCHFMLPSRGKVAKSTEPDGRYADEAISLLLKGVEEVGVKRREYQAKLFGGSDMFAATGYNDLARVGMRNIQAARNLVSGNGLTICGEHLGGKGHRSVIFEIWSGNVWIKQIPN